MTAHPQSAVTPPCAAPSWTPRSTYLWLLTWAFTLFSSLRLVAYLPTLSAIHSTGDSSQHSLWTWCSWFGANLTMAAWLYERERRFDRAVFVSIGNASMCLAAVALIVGYRV
ncbi:MAG: hypothetical protein IPL57_17725 [Rubrivivax sp.]|nr:hypothetical protein [Rubrivivax sp.]